MFISHLPHKILLFVLLITNPTIQTHHHPHDLPYRPKNAHKSHVDHVVVNFFHNSVNLAPTLALDDAADAVILRRDATAPLLRLINSNHPHSLWMRDDVIFALAENCLLANGVRGCDCSLQFWLWRVVIQFGVEKAMRVEEGRLLIFLSICNNKNYIVWFYCYLYLQHPFKYPKIILLVQFVVNMK